MRSRLREVENSWNNHHLRKSWSTLSSIPEKVGAEDFKKEFLGCDLTEIEDSVNVPTENDSLYQEYFSYSAGVLAIKRMQTWRDALAAFEKLVEAA